MPHKCCDICTSKCECGSCPNYIFKRETECLQIGDTHCRLTRHVTTVDQETFLEVVHDLNEENKRYSSVLGPGVFSNTLDDTVIKDLSDDLKHIHQRIY